GHPFVIKRLVNRDGHWLLASDNPEGPTLDWRPDTVVVARLQNSIRPEDLAPPLGSVVGEASLAPPFGVDALRPHTGRYGGHLLLAIDAKGSLVAPDRVRAQVERRKPGETAFVLARANDSWRYLGVGRWIDADSEWLIPEVDYLTWRTLGDGKDVSRR